MEAFLHSDHRVRRAIHAMRRALKLLYTFLDDRNKSLSDITYQDMWDLNIELKSRNLTASYRNNIRHFSQQYMFWMYDNGRLKENPEVVFPRASRKFVNKKPLIYELPPIALEYIENLKIVRSGATWRSHHQSLRIVYSYCEENKINLKNIQRSDLIKIFQNFRKANYSASSFNHKMCEIRLFLRHLYEMNQISSDPERLITNKDYQRKVEYLPRPLEPINDKEIQKRLEQSSHLYAKALLLMRMTGIRTGELRDLCYNCIQNDIEQNSFLRVPILKLQKERIVPLESRAIRLIEEIREISLCNFRKAGFQSGKPNNLIIDNTGRKPSIDKFQFFLEELTFDLQSDSPIIPYRFRHTYATTLLTAGMNLLEIKELLGHRSIKMTLNYAKVTQTSIRDSYYRAIENLELNYPSPLNAEGAQAPASYITLLGDIIKEVKKNCEIEYSKTPKRYSHLIKRIEGLKSDLVKIGIQ